MTAEKPNYVNLHEFDINRMIVSEPKESTGSYKFPAMNLSYKYPSGKVGKLLLVGEKQYCPGIYKILDDKTQKITGYQICYYLTSMDTVKNPTENEKYIISTFDAIRNKIIEKLSQPDTASKLPERLQKSLFRNGKLDISEIKPLYQTGSPKKTQGEQKEYGPRTFVKLIYRDVEGTFETKFFSHGGERQDIRNFILEDENSKRGFFHVPIFRFDYVYLGSAGQSNYHAFVQYKLLQSVNVTPVQRVPDEPIVLPTDFQHLTEQQTDQSLNFLLEPPVESASSSSASGKSSVIPTPPVQETSQTKSTKSRRPRE